MVKRRVVRVVQSRFEDIEVGDVVHRDPEAKTGWFEVAHISALFDGRTQLNDVSEQLTASGLGMDIVGLQLSAEVEVDPETGCVVEAATPASVITVAHVAAEEPAPTQTPAVAPEPEASEAATQAPIEGPAEDVLVNPVELAVRPAPEVDLSRVLTALTNLDVGDEQPAIPYEPAYAQADGSAAAATAAGDVATEGLSERSESPRRSTDPDTVTWLRRSPDLSPDIPAVAMPEGAEPVYGNTLPDSPSYLNPVLVRDPEAAPLPARGRRRG